MVAIHIWSDSKFLVDNCNFLLRTHRVPSSWENQHLWHLVLDRLDILHEMPPAFSWVPSHTDPKQAEDVFEEWQIRWNAAADLLAFRANKDRGSEFEQLHEKARAHHDAQLERLRLLYAFYGAIAKTPKSEAECDEPLLCVEENSFGADQSAQFDSFSDLLPIGWLPSLRSAMTWPAHLSIDFASQLTQWILNMEGNNTTMLQVSFLELTFMLANQGDIRFPVLLGGGEIVCSRLDCRMARPTVAELYGHVRRTLRHLLVRFEMTHLALHDLDRTGLHVYTPIDGLRLCLNGNSLSTAHRSLLRFTEVRHFRTAADLARPL